MLWQKGFKKSRYRLQKRQREGITKKDLHIERNLDQSLI